MNEICAAQIMGDNFIGSERLRKINLMKLNVKDVPQIPFSEDELKYKKDDYILVLGVNSFADGTEITIRGMIALFGKDPEVSEPCFYNQDWYESEDFIDQPMKEGWFFIRKTVYDDSRAVLPEKLMEKYSFPSAILCAYSFFVAWLSIGVKLWYHDFIWCNNIDHNGDRIYVGKYNDIDGVNKNGFSIHRHLSLRNCYGCID